MELVKLLVVALEQELELELVLEELQHPPLQPLSRLRLLLLYLIRHLHQALHRNKLHQFHHLLHLLKFVGEAVSIQPTYIKALAHASKSLADAAIRATTFISVLAVVEIFQLLEEEEVAMLQQVAKVQAPALESESAKATTVQELELEQARVVVKLMLAFKVEQVIRLA